MKKLEYKPYDASLVFIWALLLPLVLSVVISMCLYGSPTETNEQGNLVYTIYSETWFLCMLRLLSAGLLVGLFFVYNKSKNINGFSACGIKTKVHYLNIAYAVILGISVCYLLSPFITLITYGLSLLGLHIPTGIDLPLDNFGYYILSLLLIGALPAVTEELIYRGMIFQGLKKWGKWPAILLSALAFCLMHGNIAQFPYTFILGTILGYVMWETKALWLCMIIHFFNNTAVITSMYITKQMGGSSELPAQITTPDILIAVGMMLLAVGLVVLVFYLMKKANKKSPPQCEKVEQQETCVEVANTKTRDIILLVSGFALAILFTVIQSI